MVIVTKKGGTYHLCGDFRALNAVPVGDQDTMPRIDEIMGHMGHDFYFSKGICSCKWTRQMNKKQHSRPIGVCGSLK